MISLTPSHIIEYLFCPRFTYFEYVLAIPQYEEKNYKVMKGRSLHDNRLKQNSDYLRKKIGVVGKYLNQYLTHNYLRGIIDEVLLLSDDTMAPLDYKFAEYKDRIYDTYKTQLYCYAYLIEANYNKTVKRGYLVYTRSKNKLVEVEINEMHKTKIIKAIGGIYKIIDKNIYPSGTRYKKKCVTCHYKNICTL
ncbi:MAG: CRISPR-associated protein Cas4 [Marinilabiliales bacterium]